MARRQELHTSFSFSNVSEGTLFISYGKTTAGRGVSHGYVWAMLLSSKESAASLTVEVLYNVFREGSSTRRKPLHGGKYCCMGLWLGLLSAMYEKTLRWGNTV